MTGELAGAPVLCKRCGAPTVVQPDLSLQCRHCGAADRLPPDELGRALDIRGRLTMAAGRVAQMAGSEAALAGIFEKRGAFLTVMGPFPVVAILVIAWSLFGAYQTLSHLPAAVPDSVRLEIFVSSLYAPIFIGGFTLSMPFALLVGRFSYRRRIRPLLVARPPLGPGAPMRCRACGGDIPPAREAFVTCRYCRTPNILAESHAQDLRRRLEEEMASYRARASGMIQATSAAATHMTRTMFICFALVYVGIIGLGMITQVAIKAMS